MKKKEEELNERIRNRIETPMDEDDDSEDDEPKYDSGNKELMLDQPKETNIPKGLKWSKKRGMYYDPTAGLKRYREAIEKGERERPVRSDKITPVKPEDTVNYGKLLDIVNQQGKMIKRMLKKGNKN